MHDKKYFVGKVSDYSKKKGWFFGYFANEDLLRSDLVEVAYQDVSNKKSSADDWHYHKKCVEICIVTSGSASLKINGKEFTVEEGGFWATYPESVVEDFSTTKDTKLIVIKAPSIPDDKFTKTL
jgi:mannose-6-phosphate isomerase-like protein (cupin superfamily)